MREKLAERPEVRQEWIEIAITTPDWISADPDPTLTRSYKRIAAFGGRVLRVVHRSLDADVLVVTAYFDRGATRP